MQISLLQPTCIVGTKTGFPVATRHIVPGLQPTCIVGTKTRHLTSGILSAHHYNPRASWVLKPLLSSRRVTSSFRYYNPRASWMFRIKIAIKKRHFISDAFFKMTHKKNLLANLSNYHIPFSEIKKPPLPAMRSGKGGFLSIYKKRSRFLR